tara:strand:+ start:539 stop:712 length:174 start_codon:yes stop_codon:yes gene_type:complete
MDLLSNILWCFLSRETRERKLKEEQDEINKKRIQMLPEYKKLMYLHNKKNFNCNNDI